MIHDREGKLKTLKSVATGNVVAWFGSGRPGTIAIPLRHPDGLRQMLELPLMERTMAFNDDDVVLDFGTPLILYDLASAIGTEERPKSGTLMMLPDHFAVFWHSKDYDRQSITIPLNGGMMTEGNRDYRIPAFERWQIGFMRLDEFVSLAEVDLIE